MPHRSSLKLCICILAGVEAGRVFETYGRRRASGLYRKFVLRLGEERPRWAGGESDKVGAGGREDRVCQRNCSEARRSMIRAVIDVGGGMEGRR